MRPTPSINRREFLVKVPLHQIPYRSLTPQPQDAANLLVPVALSASRVAFCSARVEPTWMALGQAAGAAAALAVADRVPVQRVNYQKLRARLQRDGQALELPVDERHTRSS